jgi:hypothetical protein
MEVVSGNALEIAPPKTECSVCRTECKRHSIALRKVRDVAFEGERIVPVRVGVYFCPTCGKHFRLQTGLANKGKHYSKRAQEKGFVAIRDDKTTFTALPNRLARDFSITPSKSTCHRWFHERAGAIDFERDYEPKAVEGFSGALAVDEVYDGEFCLFFATDPLNKRPVSFHLCRSGNTEELMKFFTHLKQIGIIPEVLIVDGSVLYKSVPQQVWPGIRIQLCIFHAIRNCYRDLDNALRTICKNLTKRPLWSQEGYIEPDWWTETMNQRADDKAQIKRNRGCLMTRLDNLSKEQRETVSSLCSRYPAIAAIRSFQKELLSLFERNQTPQQARAKLDAMKQRKEYIENPSLRLALKRLDNDKFDKMITFLDYENLEATSNSVERMNRWFRKRQKTHYRNRTERTIKNMLKSDLTRYLTPTPRNTLVRRDRCVTAVA